jgi:hypothetical protein
MNKRWSAAGAVLGVIVFASHGAVARAAEGKEAKAQTSIQAGVAALVKEVETYVKDPKSGKLRDACDYFKENPSADVTQEQVVGVLERNVGRGDLVNAYVKWQVLSAVPGKFDVKLAGRALSAYRNAPRPTPRPGMTASEQRSLQRVVQKMNEEKMGEINDQMTEAVSRWREGNRPITAYRDALFQRLPAALVTFEAGFADALQRADAGMESRVHLEALVSAIKSWAAGDVKPNELAAVAQMANRAKGYMPAEYYNKVQHKEGMYEWTPGRAAVDVKAMDELIDYLREQAQGGGVKFKETAGKR